MKNIIVILVVVGLSFVSGAADWSYTWQGDAGKNVKASISPLKYGKKWAYSIEFDDGSSFPVQYGEKLISQFKYTDAPPGIKGGKERPFVGTCAISINSINTPNSNSLNWEQIKALQKKGWGFVNHSYWHTGIHWDPKKMNSPDQFQREIYWSMTVFGQNLYDGKYTTPYFVYPNGDYNYKKYLGEFGVKYGTRCHGSCHNINDKNFQPFELGRTLLDEHGWKKEGGKVMQSFPEPRPKDGEIFIDFTHGIDKPGSENYQRWEKRLTNIENKFGSKGDDSLWGAPSEEILGYFTAGKAAKITSKNSSIKVTIPDNIPGSALTICLEGVAKSAKFPIPERGAVYRDNGKVWITTPLIGKPGVPMPKPAAKLVYKGKIKNETTFEKPIKFAALRFLQMGNLGNNYKLDIQLTKQDGKKESMDLERIHKWVPLGNAWGRWQLYPTIPDQKPPLIKALSFNSDKSFQEMEIWAVE